MASLGNVPRTRTNFALEARKSFAFGVSVKSGSASPVNITDTIIRFTLAEPEHLGGSLLLTRNAEILDASLGLSQILLQASDLDLDEGDYPYSVTVVSPSGYSTVILKGVLVMQENTDVASTSSTYAGINPSSSVAAYIEHGQLINVNVEALDGMSELVEYKLDLMEGYKVAAINAQTASEEAADASIFAQGQSEDARDAAAVSASEALGSQVTASAAAVAAAASEAASDADAATALASAAAAGASEATATAASVTAVNAQTSASGSAVSAQASAQWAEDISGIVIDDDVMQAVDNNAASAFRVQQDSRRGRKWGLDRATYGDGVLDAIDHIEAKVDTASAAGGGEVIFDGIYRVSRPIRGRSNVTLRGLPGSKLFSLSVGGAPSAALVYPGNYHPATLHTNGGTLNYDTLAAVTGGNPTVTLTSNTHSYPVGQLVMIWTTADPYPQLTKVIAASGNVLTLQAPVSQDFSGVAFISPGGGHTTTLSGFPYVHYFIENFEIDGLHLETYQSSALARAACLNSRFKFTIDGASLVYGNAYTDCTFDVVGVYSNRAIELTDGSRGNIIRVAGSYQERGNLDASDSLCIIGRDDTVEHLRLKDSAARTGYLLSFYGGGTSRRSKYLDCTVEYSASALGSGVSVTGPENTVEKATFRSATPFTGAGGFVRVADATDFTVRDISADVPVSGSGKGIRFFSNASSGLLDRVRTPNGSLDFAATTMNNVTIRSCDVSDIVSTSTINASGKARGWGNRVRSQDEVALITNDRLTDLAVTATTETPALERTFAAAQTLHYRDRINISGLIQKGGTAGALRLKLTLGNVVVFDHTTATTVGLYGVEGYIEQTAQVGTVLTYHIRLTDAAGATVTLANRVTGFALAAGSKATLAAWKVSGGDTFTLRRWNYQFQQFLEN